MRWILYIFGGLLVGAAALVWLQSTRLSTDATVPEKPAAAIRVASYNVHYIALARETGPWSVGDWERRKEPLAQAVAALEADIIAFQEMESFARGDTAEVNLARTWLLSELPEYRAGAVGDPATFPSTQPIFYRHDRYTQTEQGWFFFSETPDVIYSRTFDGSFPAFASWVELYDTKAERRLRVVNLHTDFASYHNRVRSIELIATRITPWLENGHTVLVAGDFNARLGSALHERIERTGLSFVPLRATTYHFNRGLNLFGAIDHIAYSDALTRVSPPIVLQRQFAGEWPTDHYPIAADLRWRAQP